METKSVTETQKTIEESQQSSQPEIAKGLSIIAVYCLLYMFLIPELAKNFFLKPLEQFTTYLNPNFNSEEIFLAMNGYLGVISGTIVLVILIILTRKELKIDFKKYIRSFSECLNKTFITIGMLFLGAFISGLIMINILGVENQSDNQVIINEIFSVSPYVMAFLVCIFAPIAEELVFRLGISKIIKNKVVYVLVAGLTFGFIHVYATKDFINIIPYATLGIVLSAAYYKTKNIWVTIGAHAIYNSVVLLLPIILKPFLLS